MLGRLRNTRNDDGAREDQEPLLDSTISGGDVAFSIEDDYDENEEPIEHSMGDTGSRVPPQLKSMTHSREVGEWQDPVATRLRQRSRAPFGTEFELDTDELDETSIMQLSMGSTTSPQGPDDPQRMPLLVGLMDSAALRGGDSGRAVRMTSRGAGGTDDDVEIDLQELMQQKTKGGGMLDSVANMANSILGAGIIGLPYAVAQAGFFTGILLLVVLCAVTDWTIRLIVINAKLSGRSSYIDIMDHCFGSSGKAAVSLFQFSFAFGGMCAFGIIIGDTIPHVIRSLFPSLADMPVLYLLTNRHFIIVLCTVGVSYPLSLYRDISKLSRASGFALVGMIIIVISVLVEGPRVSPELMGNPDARFSLIRPRVLEAIGVISFAFVCHHNSLLIYGSLRTPTLDRFALVTHLSTILSLVACCTLAISAFLVFTDKTQGNILNNFAPNDTLINVARFCFGLNMFTTLPLELFVCREVIEQYFFSHESYNQQRHILFTTSILFASMFISLITCDLGVMLEIVGGIGATALAFIFPAACYIRLLPKHVSLLSRQKLPAVACAGFGIAVLVLSVALALGKASTEDMVKQCS